MDFLYLRTLINNINFYRFTRIFIVCFIALLFFVSARDSQSATSNDPHYSSAGFFDIHVCNWPGRPLFFMTLFSTYRFNDISNIQVFSPDDIMIGELDLSKFRIITDKNKKEKRVFINQFEIPVNAKNGWYYTKVNFKNNKPIISKDYVIIDNLEITSISTPNLNKELDSIPKSFTWKKVPGAQYYQVFIRDNWDSKLIHKTKLVKKPELQLPDNLLKKGGIYSIQIHARDTNEHQLLGDFNHGSLTKQIEFSIAE